MNRVVFETGTLTEVLRKVSRVMPHGKADAFDLAGGIVMRVRPGEPVVVQGTNLELFYTEWVDALSIEGAAVDWRLPDRIADLVSSLPPGTGHTVELTEGAGVLTVRSGRMSGTLRMVGMAGYPAWRVFDTGSMTPVAAMGDRIAQIAWACHKDETPLTGIWMDGQHLVAVKRTTAARVACPWKEPPPQPVVAPMKLLGSVIRHSGDVMIGSSDGQLTICPDEWTQIRCVTYGERFPNLGRALVTSYEQSCTVGRKAFHEAASRLSKVVRGKGSNIKVLVGGGAVGFAITGEDKGEVFRDHIDAPGADHPPVLFSFGTDVLLEGLSQGQGEDMRMHYDLGHKAGRPVHITDGHGYETWYMQRKDV